MNVCMCEHECVYVCACVFVRVHVCAQMCGAGQLTELPMCARASLARSLRVGKVLTAKARVMWEQNSTEMPTACNTVKLPYTQLFVCPQHKLITHSSC